MITQDIKKRIYTSIVLLFLSILILKFNYILVFSLIVLGLYSLIEFFNISNKILKNKLYLLITNSLFTVYIFTFCFMFFVFSNFLQFKIILLILLLGCISSDIGGFVIGKIFKGPKLTKISPNKTVSGAIGSLIFTCVVISSAFYYFVGIINYNILIIGLLTSLACQLGDLFFSFLKRKAKIKDTGNFLPGHGGVIDRLDGIFFGVPFGFIILVLLY
jgi:phosphatidate cytidylyltransferase